MRAVVLCARQRGPPLHQCRARHRLVNRRAIRLRWVHCAFLDHTSRVPLMQTLRRVTSCKALVFGLSCGVRRGYTDGAGLFQWPTRAEFGQSFRMVDCGTSLNVCCRTERVAWFPQRSGRDKGRFWAGLNLAGRSCFEGWIPAGGSRSRTLAMRRLSEPRGEVTSAVVTSMEALRSVWPCMSTQIPLNVATNQSHLAIQGTGRLR